MIAGSRQPTSRPTVRSPEGADAAAMRLTGRPHISYSAVSSYQACPLRWHFQYVERAEHEQKSAAMLLGACVHRGLQQHLEALLAADNPPDVDSLMMTYREAWEGEAGDTPIQFSRTDTAESLAETAQRIFEQFLGSEHAQPAGEIVGIEESLNIRLADDIPSLAARVDLITKEGNELVVTDYKTARSMWSQATAEEHADQLTLYSQAAAPVAEELGTKIRVQFIVLTKAKTPKIEAIRVPVSVDRVDRTKLVVRRVFRAMQARIVYPSPSQMNCTGCPFRQRCERWHRETGQ